MTISPPNNELRAEAAATALQALSGEFAQLGFARLARMARSLA